MADKKAKEEWVYRLALELRPFFKSAGFRICGKRKFVFKHKSGCEWRYILSIRHPRYSDDPHQLYINPCVHIDYPEIKKATSLLTNNPINKDFPTLGGSLGLYSEGANSKEWPVDCLESALAFASLFRKEINDIAYPFWENLTPRSNLLKAVESKSKWAIHADSWKYNHLVLRHLEHGIDYAMDLVERNRKKFWEIDLDLLKVRLAELNNVRL